MKVLISLLFTIAAAGVVRSAVVVCQHSSWSAYRSAPGNFSPSLIDPSLCTHGVYAFAGLNPEDQFVASDPYTDLEGEGWLGGYKEFVDLKKRNPDFKAMLALGGWTAADAQYAQIAADPARRKVVTQSAVDFLKLHGFDGLEVDWLFPAGNQNASNFAVLLSEMREAFDPEGLLLTASVASNYWAVGIYDLPSMERSLDFMIMMTYEYNGPWWLVTAIHAPMSQVNYTVQAYLNANVSPAKLVLSVPAYGHSYTLANPDNHGLGHVASAPGAPGLYTRTPGTLSFNEIFKELDRWTVERDELNQAPYAYRGDQWVSYDDEVSAQFKVDLIKDWKLGGAAIWTVGDDSFEDNAFPIVKKIYNGLQ